MMIMKKLFFLSVVYLLLLISCTQDNNRLSGNPSEVLDFETYNKLQQQYKTIKKFQEGTAVVKKEKYGLIDGDGREILPCEYDTIHDLRKNFRIIVKDSLFGATNIDGEIIKQCIYSGARNNSFNYIALKLNDKWGFADMEGKDITQYKYEEIWSYDDTSFVAKYDGYYGVSDFQQNTLIPFKYDRIYYKDSNESNPVSVVKSGEFYGLYNSRNQLVAECEYDEFFPDTSRYVTLSKGESRDYKSTRKGLIDAETGKIMIPFDYLDMGEYSEGLVAAKNLDGNCGYLDLNGNLVVPFIYKQAGDFSEGLAAVYKQSGEFMNTVGFGRVEKLKCGYIDKKGNVIIPFKFQQCLSVSNSEFHDGLAVQGYGRDNLFVQKYGYINKQGEWVVKPKYDEAAEFKNGVAEVVIQEKYGYINTKGDLIIPCNYDKYGGYFVNDSTIRMEKDGKPYYFNLQGQPVLEPD